MLKTLSSKLTNIILATTIISSSYCIFARPLPVSLNKNSEPIYRSPYVVHNHLINTGCVAIATTAITSSVEIIKSARKK